MPAPVLPQPPMILTARAFADAHGTLVARLSAAGYALRVVATWEDVLHEAGSRDIDAVLVDFDAVEGERRGHRVTLSAFRLVRLLSRQISDSTASLIVFTAMDYAEIEEVAYAIHQLISPLTPLNAAVALIEATLAGHSRLGASTHSESLAEPVRASVGAGHTANLRFEGLTPSSAC